MKHILLLILSVFFLYACDDSESLPNPRGGSKEPIDTTTKDTTSSTASDLSVATWNVEFFPKGNNTVSLMNQVLSTSDLTIIAFQEMSSQEAFNTLDDLLTQYEGAWVNVRGSLDHAFLINTRVIGTYQISSILSGDSYAFPREPAVLSFMLNGDQYRIVNLHLKCCDDGRERRKDAAFKLRNYILENYNDDHVIILGDFNDGIFDEDIFDAFLTDIVNFKFIDESIQLGPSANWSYPSWPSHLDHILITDELFGYENVTETWKLDQAVPSYFNQVSDHRPVVGRFTFN